MTFDRDNEMDFENRVIAPEYVPEDAEVENPLRDRFGVVLRLELYEPKELAKIVTRSAGILGIDIEADGALEIASRSRGTPRIANRMLKRVRDFAQIMSDGVITYSTAKIALDRLEIDELGLDSGDRRMLNAIIQYYNGGPVGVETLAAAIGEEAVTIEDVVEPYLMQIGFLQRTPRGRCRAHQQIKPPPARHHRQGYPPFERYAGKRHGGRPVQRRRIGRSAGRCAYPGRGVPCGKIQGRRRCDDLCITQLLRV